MTDIKIGFIGQGWIGKHYADNFEERGYNIIRYDRHQYKENLEQLLNCDIVFVAVPTPSTTSGFNDAILIDAIRTSTRDGQIIVIKSTIQVGTTDKIQELFPNRYIFHSPEFLTEKTAKYDAANPARNIVGYTERSRRFAQNVMNVLPIAPYETIVPCKEAELVKYGGNIWFYFKIMVINLIFDVAEYYDLDYEVIKDMLAADKRIGRTHLDVFHQGGRGAGGDCFIKDLEAFREMYKKINLNDVNHAKEGLSVLQDLANLNKKLLRNTGKSLDLLDGVYGKENNI